MKDIYFYSPRNEYGFLSNFYWSKFVLDGFTWHTSEHYYQAMKFEGTKHYEIIRDLALTPKQAAIAGRNPKRPLRSDWEQVKDDVMRLALICKFGYNKHLRWMLVDTYPSYLIENSPVDYYWGCGRNNTGKNRLGELLVEVRDLFICNGITG